MLQYQHLKNLNSHLYSHSLFCLFIYPQYCLNNFLLQVSAWTIFRSVLGSWPSHIVLVTNAVLSSVSTVLEDTHKSSGQEHKHSLGKKTPNRSIDTLIQIILILIIVVSIHGHIWEFSSEFFFFFKVQHLELKLSLRHCVSVLWGILRIPRVRGYNTVPSFYGRLQVTCWLSVVPCDRAGTDIGLLHSHCPFTADLTFPSSNDLDVKCTNEWLGE